MKVLFFYAGTPTPVLETELELIRLHELKHDEVRVLQCTGELPNCFWNKRHEAVQCAACRSRFAHGWQVLGAGPTVELRAYPPMDLAGIELPTSFESVAELSRFRYDGENLGMGVASSLISFYRDHRFDTVARHPDVMRELRTVVQSYETLKREISDFAPDCVYIFNGRISTHLPAYLLCRRLGIDFYSFELANRDNCYRLLRNQRIHEPVSHEDIASIRRHWTPEHHAIGEAVVRRRREGRHLAKVVMYRAGQVQGSLPPGFDPARRNIAMFCGSIDEYAAVESWGSPLYLPDETAGVARIVDAFAGDDRFMFYLRVHPNLKDVPASTSQLRDIRALAARCRNLHVIWPAENIDSYALVDACEKTVSFGSTIGIEAAYWGKPSILAGRAHYENMGSVYRPATHDELVDLVRSELAPLPALPAVEYFYWEVTEGTPYHWFRETGIRGTLAQGTFDGVRVRAHPLLRWGSEVMRLFRGALGVIREPSHALVRLRQYAKTIR